MSKSKSINLFLIDGDPAGRVKCTMQNWTGVAYKIPRIKLEDCRDGESDIVKHLKQTGIYFLLGEDQNSGKPIIYVGQAVLRKNGEGLLLRLTEHKKNEKESHSYDWNEAICFTTQNDALGATEISYLENRFTNLALNAGRYSVQNGNEPNPGNITEEKKSEMEEFIEYARIIVCVLGHKVFEPLIKETSQEEVNDDADESAVFHFQSKKIKAEGKITNEGFVVLKGSEISPKIQKSASQGTINNRNLYTDKIKDGVLLADCLFKSQSGAASFVGGTSLNGNKEWKTDDGKSPKDF